jgi:DNA-binding NtrC family response regulator
VRVSCAAPAEELARELFGADGAAGRRAGALELARGGTVLLDEIAELPAALQEHLLQALDAQQAERARGTAAPALDARLLASTRRDLGALAASGAFHAGLYHRLQALEVEVPPLRARRDDVPAFVEAVLSRRARESGAPPPLITADAMALLTHYDWPGNVRELEAALESAAATAQGAPITSSTLPPRIHHAGGADGTPAVPGASFAEIERHAILSTYDACGHNVTRAAEVLGVSPRTIHYRLREYQGLPGRRQVRGVAAAARAHGARGAVSVGRPDGGRVSETPKS